MAAPARHAEPDRKAIQQAAMWQVQLADEECTDADRAAFDDWLNADPTHRSAFDRMSGIVAKIAPHGRASGATIEALLRRPGRSSQTLALALVGATAALLGFAMRDIPALRAPLADERTAVGELKSAQLRTHDQLTLDTDTAADIGEDRSVRLWRGRVMADVQPGLARPFVVRTAQGSVRALGTRFSVGTDGVATVVAVMESRVEACATKPIRACLVLTPGQTARLDARGIQRLDDIDPLADAAWSQGLLIADDRPLTDVLAELNRYRDTPIRFSATDLAGLRLSGALPLTDSARALITIRSALPVEVEREPGGLLVRRR